MTDDDFGKTSGKLIENTAIGAAGIAGTVIAGPAGGAVAGAVVMTALDWLRASANAADGRVFDARFSALEDQVKRLDEEVRKVKADLAAEDKQADRQDFLSQEAVYSEFARAVAGARTHEKRAALVNAAARQFDPRRGSAPIREFWFDQVKSLSDIQITVIERLAESKAGIIDGEFILVGQQSEPVPSPPLSDGVALGTTMRLLAERPDAGRLVEERGRDNVNLRGTNYTTSSYTLSGLGRGLADFIG